VSKKDPSVVVLTYSRKASQGQLVATDADISSLVPSLHIRDKFGNVASAYDPSRQALAPEATGTFELAASQTSQAFSRLAAANAVTTSTVRQWIPSKQADIFTLPNGQVLYFRTFYDDSGTQVGKLVRLNQDGSLDISFGEGGIATEPNPTNRLWRSFAVGVDGAITVAGNSGNGFGVWRYRQDGTLDPSFGNGGWLESQFLQDQTATAVGVMALRDGRVLVYGGTALSDRVGAWPAAVMLRSDGTRDPGFGVNGVVYFEGTSGPNPAWWSIINARELSDGRIMLATYPNNVATSLAFKEITRLNADGTVDTSYGTDGFAGTFLPQFTHSEGAGLWIPGNPTVITEAGEVIRFGEIFRQPNNLSRRALVKLTASGSLDLSVGQGGVVELQSDPSESSMLDAEVDAEGRLVVVGSASFYDEIRDGGSVGQVWRTVGASWRFTSGLALDSTYGEGGAAYWRSPQFRGSLWDLAFTADGGLWASGLDGRSSTRRDALIRVTAQGAVLSSAMPALFETLTDGTSGNDSLTGTEYSNILKSADGNDVVNAGAGADLVVGGTGRGNDRYDGGAGIDTVSYTSALAAITVDLEKGRASSTARGDSAAIGTDTLSQIENMVGGAHNDTLLGNALANSLAGGRGDDLLDGRRGADKLYGGIGADTYIVDNPLDVVVESADEGVDRVVASISYTLPMHVEHLTLTGKSALQAVGNSLANTLIGNAASNVLVGGGSADVMDGAGGGDIYLIAAAVDHAVGEVIADSGKPSKTGVDEIRFSSVAEGDSLVLRGATRGIERVVIGTGTAVAADRSGTTSLNVDASALASGIALIGNAGANVLRGTGFGDTLSGGRGRDELEGGLGADLFDLTGVTVASDGDVIRDFQAVAGDRLILSDGLTSRRGAGKAAISAVTRAEQIVLNTGTKGSDVFVLNDVNNQPGIDLGLATNGTILLAALSSTAQPAALTTSTPGGRGYVLAYDNGNAYLYCFAAGVNDRRVTADEIALVTVLDSDADITPGALGAVHCVMQ